MTLTFWLNRLPQCGHGISDGSGAEGNWGGGRGAPVAIACDTWRAAFIAC